MLLLSVFSVLALVLAAVGIVGVVGHSVAQRTQEIGIRMALGARTYDVLRLIVNNSMAWVLIGLAAGVAGSARLT
jgi:ABC-type antimicrobial peptide transport system permease subunit